MPKYNTGQDFDEAFISGLQFQQKINLQRDELQQDIMFKIRQQSLTEDYYNSLNADREQDNIRQQQQNNITKQKTEFDISSKYKIDETGLLGSDLNKQFEGELNPFEADKKYSPLTEGVKPQDLYEDMGIESRGGKPFDRKRNKLTGEIEYFPHYEKPEKTNDGTGSTKGKGADISGEVGEMNKIITLMDSLAKEDDTIEYEKGGETVSVSKVFLRGEGKKYMSDAMTKAGVPLEGDLVAEIRSKSGIKNSDSSKIKRQKLKDTIDFVRSQGGISDTEYEALKYWSE